VDAHRYPAFISKELQEVNLTAVFVYSTFWEERSWITTCQSILASVRFCFAFDGWICFLIDISIEGYFNCCCFKAGSCGEQTCPDCCLCFEAHCCNFLAVSASRVYVMEKYDLTSDPCDYRLIRCNNCLQLSACLCNILAIFIKEFKELARIIDMIANIFYHCISGCMTAQVYSSFGIMSENY